MTDANINFNHNDIIYQVSEVSQAIKRMVEDRFGLVKIRGEITGFKCASSGHAYFRLKDEDAVMDAVCWRGTMSKLAMTPEDGLEVVATGKLTTYPGRSSYQIVVSHMEPAGAGALMALLEKRRTQLEAEGLFAEARKKSLPYMPRVVGVITSPTGAVIRDIIHRIQDRFPCHILVWPVPVQGEGAAEKIASAIQGFNALNPESRIPKPDVLIVARGGGSLEDLWAFNEEIVVRAAANSTIPLIAAVGHETDTTLIDYAADRRAPTPTAAAEMAVPVLAELKLGLAQLDARLHAAIKRQHHEWEHRLTGLVRGLPKPQQLLEMATQRLDDWSERLLQSLPQFIAQKTQSLALLNQRLEPRGLLKEIGHQQVKLNDVAARSSRAMPALIAVKHQQLTLAIQSLQPQLLLKDIKRETQKIKEYTRQLNLVVQQKITHVQEKLEGFHARLENVNVQRVLERGFALVRGDDGTLIRSQEAAKEQRSLEIQFADGRIKTSPT